VSQPFSLRFADGRVALGVRVREAADVAAAVHVLHLPVGRPTLVLVGGATGLGAADLDRLRPLFTDALAPVAAELGATLVDGGTDAGVMRLMGESHARLGLRSPLVGIAAEGTVRLPGARPAGQEAARLEPHHTHFVLVPGTTWGDESAWIARVADVLAKGAASVTLLVNGGTIAQQDVKHSLAARRRVIVVAGSGRTADALARALVDVAPDSEYRAVLESGLLRRVELSDGPAAVARLLRQVLQPASSF
jgi:hypothetical protein